MKNQIAFLFSAAAAALLCLAACSATGGPNQDVNAIGSGAGAGGQLMCTAPAIACGNECADTTSNSNHCGGCNTPCPSGSSCGGGVCQCLPGFGVCNGLCTDTFSDATNCGTCGNVCGPGTPFCSAGVCAASCGVGLAQCGSNACVDVMNSPLNCGSCGNVCPGGQACTGGVCGCAVGQEPCNGACVAAGQCQPGIISNPGGGGATSQAGTGPGNTAGGTATGMGGSTQTVTGTAGTTGMAGSTATGTAGASSGSDPAGYWRFNDWFGCAWTGVDNTNVGTTAMPQDFTTHTPGDPYCVSGTVGPHEMYESVALLGFNLAEPAATADCSYTPVDPNEPGPPSVQLTQGGLALNFVKQGGDTGFTLRAQIQGPDGARDDEVGENDRWCATIEEVQGKVFVEWSDFNTKCWDGTGNDYNGEPISAIVFLVPGDPTATPYNFCVNGFAAGNGPEDAPDGTAQAGDQTGTVGSNAPDGDFERAKVLVNGENYIIQNNNWGNPDGTDLILNYTNNSFVIASGSGNGGPSQGAPASFPSIYIGANGNTANGVYATSTTDNLPRQTSQIGSINTTLSWSGSTSEFNVTYDVWFAASPPQGEYEDGIDGFLMVWFRDPAGAQPIGSQVGSATIGGQAFTVWSGPRGDGPAGYNDAPVVSYVANSQINSWTFNLKEFFTNAESNSWLPANLYLTDVFGGFEIWSGGAGGNLSVTEFSCVVE